jgi:glycosyltransferase involved in cell wall biosynthesis
MEVNEGLAGHRPLKVLFVTHTSLVSGAEGALLDLIEAMSPRVTSIAMCPAGPLADMLTAIGVEVTEFSGAIGSLRLDPRLTLTTAGQILSSARVLRRAVAETAVDVVHANSVRAALITGCAQTFRHTPTVVHVHDAVPATRTGRFVRRVVRSTADAVITISEYTAENFAEGGARTGIKSLDNPLNIERFDPVSQTQDEARATLQLQSGDELIGLIAQITPWKGHDVAIRALSLLHARHPDARLLVIGDVKFAGRAIRYDNVAYLRLLHRLVAELGLEGHVEFWGERSDVVTIARALDVLVAPSWEEPFGRSLIEAMAMETAVVATNVGGPREYIEHGSDGFLLSPKDVPAWAATLASLFDDPVLRRDIGRRGSRKVRGRFERGAYAEKVVQVYDDLLSGAAAATASGSGRMAATAMRQDSPNGAGGRVRRRPKRLRILFVEHSSLIGGGQRSLLELMRVLEAEHEVILACPPGPLAETTAGNDIAVVSIPDSQLTFKFDTRASSRQVVRALRARSALRAHIERLKPDVVHANSLRAGLLVDPSHDRFAFVVHCRDLLPVSAVAAALQRVIVHRSSAVVAVSKASAARLAGPRWAERSVVVIDNPVDGARFDPARANRDDVRSALGVDGAPILGVVAQITPWKGQHRAVRVLELVRRTHPNAQLLLIGETKFVTPVTRYDNRAYEHELKELVKQLRLDDAVHFLGEREDVDRIMAALDVLLVPSTEEPFGRTVIEALAMCLPVVATNAGGPAEVIRSGVDGYVLPPDDLDAWANAIRVIMRRGKRYESRPYALERFDPERHAAAVLSLYAGLVDSDHAESRSPPASSGWSAADLR